MIPAGAVLVEKQDGFAGGAYAGGGAGGLDFHQGDEAMDFGLLRGEFGEDAAETQGFFAERGAHPVVTGGGGIAFVEDEVDDFEDGGEARGKLGLAGNLEGDASFGEAALGANDALGDGRLWDEEGAGDFVGGETAEEAKGEGDASLWREHRMTGNENEAEEVVANGVVDRCVEIGHGPLLLHLKLAAEFFMFALEKFVAAPVIDGAMLRGGHQPSAGIIWDAGAGPLLEGGYQSVLGEFFGDADVADDASQAGDDAGRLDAPDGVDGAMGIGGD